MRRRGGGKIINISGGGATGGAMLGAAVALGCLLVNWTGLTRLGLFPGLGLGAAGLGAEAIGAAVARGGE